MKNKRSRSIKIHDQSIVIDHESPAGYYISSAVVIVAILAYMAVKSMNQITDTDFGDFTNVLNIPGAFTFFFDTATWGRT